MANKEKVLSLRFNQDHSYFICSLESSVRIFSVEPLVEVWHLYTKDIGSMGVVEMLQRSDIVNFVSGGLMPKYADNTVIVYKCAFKDKEIVFEYTFSSPVLSIRVNKTRLVTAHKNEINIFSYLNNSEHICAIETRANPLGLLEMTPGPTIEKVIICFPAKKRGEVRIVDLANIDSNVSQPPMALTAHANELACMSLNQEGNLLATASKNGTLIRVWDTIRKVKVAELRRGTDPATLYCINFSGDSDFLCCSSDKGTVHVFAVKDTKLNRKSTLSGMGLGDYVESQWALTNFTVAPECACICAFGPNSAVYAICFDGSFHKYTYKIEGTCQRLSFDMFPDICQHWESLLY